MHRLAVLATHPIQYYAPLFRILTTRRNVNVRVFYGWEGHLESRLDHGFGQEVKWDIPLLDGYAHEFVPNESRNPGTGHFGGIWSSRLLDRIGAWRPDALLVYGWNFRSHLHALRRLHGRLPIFFRGDSTLLDEQFGLRTAVRRSFLTWVYRHVDFALYPGQRSRDYFAKHGLDPAQLIWAPHSIENERFIDDDGSYLRGAIEWRRALSIQEEARVVVFAGKLERRKAPELLLEVFLARDRLEEHLIIAGSGVLESELRSRAGTHPRVHFVGFQNQSRMPVVYRLGDVYVMPSRIGETWGLGVNEAMASGRPAIVSDRVGCAPDLVQSGRTGVVFQNDDQVALRVALERVLDAPGAAAQMGAAARNLIDGWSLHTQAERIEAGVEAALTRQIAA